MKIKTDYNVNRYKFQHALKRYPLYVKDEPTWLTLAGYFVGTIALIVLLGWVRML